jgi:NADPH:quinone reductase-like Zn-dependent oxidoreductase
MQTFDIPRHRIFPSRTTAFYAGIMEATNGVGVDVVLSPDSASGELLPSSWNCTAEFGTFVDISQGQSRGQSQGLLGVDPFDANRTFVHFDILRMIEKQPQRIERYVHEAGFCYFGPVDRKLI